MVKRKRFSKIWLVIIAIALFVTFYQLPYYVTTPGMAKELEPIIEVDGGYEEEGQFMLTTVRMGKANLVQYYWAKFNDYHYLIKEEDMLSENETDEQYHKRQLHMMDTSKDNAIIVAYQKAGKEILIENKGVYVMGILEGMPAETNLKFGDLIYAIDSIEMGSSKELIEYVSTKGKGDQLKIDLIRDGENHSVIVPLASFPNDPKRVGLGIHLSAEPAREVTVKPAITIDTNEIGGPSAGLMFSLEIYNQLTEIDITKGYQIAGTGTMSDEGLVGPIGGIKQKVVAAHKAGADIFFAPNENGAEDSNYKDALFAAEDINTNMKIVPVDTFDDAIHYLENFPKSE